MPRVYVGMTADVLHHGHINVLEQARQLGDVIIGLLTDEAVSKKKRLPALTFSQRKKILENLVGVVEVVPQESWDYSENLAKYKPEFMVHGDDWVEGPESKIRRRCLGVLESYGGQLVEVEYTRGVSSGALVEASLALGTTPEIRRRTLRRLLESKGISRFLEAHSPLSAIVAERVVGERNDEIRRFDGFWSSSLTDSTVLGKPDIEVIDLSHRLQNINQIFEVTSLPLIFDGDTGGQPEHFEINVRSIERLGVSAVIIEDKKGLKKNSLLGNEVIQTQEDPITFAEKIQRGKQAAVTDEFMVFARIESLILEAGLDDALTRARVYSEAGADGIMIHSRDKDPRTVFDFAKSYREDFPDIPLVCVPTTYNQVTDDELEAHGFNIIIYANHMLRASYPSMLQTAKKILDSGRSMEVEDSISPISDILSLIPGTR